MLATGPSYRSSIFMAREHKFLVLLLLMVSLAVLNCELMFLLFVMIIFLLLLFLSINLSRWFWLLQIWLEQIRMSIWSIGNIFGTDFNFKLALTGLACTLPIYLILILTLIQPKSTRKHLCRYQALRSVFFQLVLTWLHIFFPL